MSSEHGRLTTEQGRVSCPQRAYHLLMRQVNPNTIQLTGHRLWSSGKFFKICLSIKISGHVFCKSLVEPWNLLLCCYKFPRCGFQILARFRNHTLWVHEQFIMTNNQWFQTCFWKSCGKITPCQLNPLNINVWALPDRSSQSNHHVWWPDWAEWAVGKIGS